MATETSPSENRNANEAQPSTTEKVKNPFENNQPVEKDIEEAQQQVDNEQQYKEALTERD